MEMDPLSPPRNPAAYSHARVGPSACIVGVFNTFNSEFIERRLGEHRAWQAKMETEQAQAIRRAVLEESLGVHGVVADH